MRKGKAKVKKVKQQGVHARGIKSAKRRAAKKVARAAKKRPLSPTLPRKGGGSAQRQAAGVKSTSTSMPAKRETRRLKDIKVGNRHRKEMGDLAELARWIDFAGGLIQPICIRTDNTLIAGERRLAAWPMTKFRNDPIPVHVIDIDKIVRGEFAENAGRKNFTLEEMVAIKRDIEPLMKAAAKERQAHGATAPGKQAEQKREAPVRAADQVAAFVGKDRRTIEKAEAVVMAAEEDPKKFGQLKADMNRTGNANGPFNRLKVMRQVDELKKRPPALPGNGPYETAVFDYPWPQEPDATQEEIEARGRSLRPYPPIAIKDGCHLMRERFAPLLAEKCTVYFWTTNFHMPYAYQLLGALGFTASSTIGTWIKNEMGRGRILRDQTEHCIIMHRGGALIAHTNDTTVWMGPGWETRGNSQKASAFYELVMRKSPAQRYLAAFSCGGLPPLWDEYGNEAGKYDAAAQKGVHARLDEKAAPAALGIAALGTALERVDAGEKIQCDAELTAALAELVKGKHKLKLTAQGRNKLSEIRIEQNNVGLDAIAQGNPIAEAVRDRLLSYRYIVGKAKPKLTKIGEGALTDWRKQQAERALLATLPDDIEALIVDYRETLQRRHEAVLAVENAAAESETHRLEMLALKACGGESFGMATMESPAQRLWQETAAPLGEVPMWGQRGLFRIEIAGVPYLCEHDEDLTFNVYAEDGDKGFVSDSGFQSFAFHEEFAFGHTVSDQFEAYIAEEIAGEVGFNGKRKPRKEALPLPDAWHRLPTSWDEQDKYGDRGEVIEVGRREAEPAPKSRAKKESSPAAAADAADRGGDDPAAENSIPAASEKSALIARAVAAGHTITMTLDHVNASTSYEVATCQCSWSARVRRGPNSARKIDEAVEAHWRAETASPPPAEDQPDLVGIPGFLRREDAEAPA